MNRGLLAIVVLGCSAWLSPPVLAEGPGQPAAKLAGLAPLVGKTWRGTFPDGKMHDTQQFEWILGGQFLRNTHAVSGADGQVVYSGETIYGWDYPDGELKWWYFNTTGGYISGTLVETENGWLAEGDNRAPEGQPAQVRSEMLLTESGWTSVSWFMTEQGWKKRFAIPFFAIE